MLAVQFFCGRDGTVSEDYRGRGHTRRRFLAAAAGVAGALLTRPGQVAAGMFTGKIRKAVKYGMIGEGATPLEKLRLIRELGFDGVEPGVNDPVDPVELKAAAEETGVAIHGVVLGSVEDLSGAVDRAVLYGAESVLITAGRVDGTTPYAVNYDRTQETIRLALPYAAERRVTLLLENVWNNFLLSPLEMRRYVDELDSEWLGVYFDVGNVVRFGWPEHWIAVLGKRIKKLDIKEYSREKQNNEGLWKGFNVKIGAGSIDWVAVRNELVGIGYEGWATAEVSGGGRERLADIGRRMDKVLDL